MLIKKINKLFFYDRLYVVNLLSSFLSQAFSGLSIVVLTPKLMLQFGDEQFAVYGILLNVIAFGSIFDLGMNSGLLRRLIHEPSLKTKLISSVLFTYTVIVLFSMCGAFLLFFFFREYFHGINLLHVFLVGILIFQTLASSLYDIVIQSTQQIFKAKLIRIVKIILELVCIILLMKTVTLEIILGIMIVFNFVYILALKYYANSIDKIFLNLLFFDKQLILFHLKYSFWYFLTSLSAVLVFNSQIFILGNLAGSLFVVQFLLLSRFFEIIRLAISNFSVVLFPAIVSNEVLDPTVLKKMFINAILRVFILLLFVIVLLQFIGYDLFLWWSKNRYTLDKNLFTYFIVYTSLILVDNVSALFLSALKLNKLPTIVSLAQGLIILLLTPILYRHFGLNGVILCSCIALGLTNLFYNPIYLLIKLNNYNNTVYLKSE